MVGESEEIQGGTVKDIPYIAHESEMARLERVIKRMFILIIILILLLFGTNAGWLWYESQFEDVETTVTQELDSGKGGNAIINDGVHINGEGETNSNDQAKSPKK